MNVIFKKLSYLLLIMLCLELASSCNSDDDDEMTDDDASDDDTADDDTSDDDLVSDDDSDYVLFGTSSELYTSGDDAFYRWRVYQFDDLSHSWMMIGFRDERKDALRVVWASAPNDVFVVGGGGVIWHYDGVTWQQMASSTEGELLAVWGSGKNDVYAAGRLRPLNQEHPGHVVLHFDGNDWSTVQKGQDRFLCGLGGSDESNVFAVGAGLVLHFNGIQWTSMEVDSSWFLRRVWSLSDTDAFAVGSENDEVPLIAHFDGLSWSRMSVEWPNDLYALSDVWGTEPTNVYAVGFLLGDTNNAMVFHYDGESWSLMEKLDLYGYCMWGSSNNNIFVAGQGTANWDGSDWNYLEHSPELWDIYGVKL